MIGRFLVRVVCAWSALGAVSCTSLTHFRTGPELGGHETCRATATETCARSSLVETDAYLLGFVEFDDLGWFWNRRQKDDVVAAVRAAAEKDDLLLVVFAHGWNHNAREGDGNVRGFRQVLDRLTELERESARLRCQSPRRVVGVYLGWRGLAFRGGNAVPSVLYNWLSFPSRKSTAHRIGSEDAAELLADLEKVRNTAHEERPDAPRPTRYIVTGHSFGTAVIHGAVSRILAARRTYLKTGDVGDAEFGDMVLLVNPAIEASLLFPFAQVSTEAAVARRQQEGIFHPVLAVLMSEGDRATGVAFPFGRKVTTLLKRHRRENPDGFPTPPRFQGRAARTAVGHFVPTIGYLLCPAGETRLAAKLECTKSTTMAPSANEDDGLEWQSSVTNQLQSARQAQEAAPPFARGERDSLPFSTATLFPLQPGPMTPYPIIRVDKRLIEGHNDIFTDWFAPFLVEFVSTWQKPIGCSCREGEAPVPELCRVAEGR